jgi:hypothetical protein
MSELGWMALGGVLGLVVGVLGTLVWWVLAMGSPRDDGEG